MAADGSSGLLRLPTKRRPIAIMRRSSSDSPVTASQMDWVFGRDNIRIHDLRHTFASTAVASDQGLPMIGKRLGMLRCSRRQGMRTLRPIRSKLPPIKLRNH